MTTHIATPLGRILCGHLALAMSGTATLVLLEAERYRAALYLLWAALPVTAAAWALARAHEKRRLRRERDAHTARPADWTSVV
ncbi:hypothetical protein OKJ48_10070 [Streptomyces kunmingensis]|uniref:Integral membrane protein n=1 Tax=Streptomyces kunmingensis TaxID=68225 RepID=A0ABU6C8B5_9ACTN|nr:hypothetical protein [Streptomyces kunmingensis]MEB3960585.1 hypothetical protein [Streptomyces kunmingensis]